MYKRSCISGSNVKKTLKTCLGNDHSLKGMLLTILEGLMNSKLRSIGYFIDYGSDSHRVATEIAEATPSENSEE